MAGQYPFLISIPHGGETIPPEVADRVIITRRDIFFDGDPHTRQIYDFRDDVAAFIEMQTARTIIDLNRAPYTALLPGSDGVIKRITSSGTPVYREGRSPDNTLIRELLRRYYYPYHTSVSDLLDARQVQLAFDCHSMLPYPPPVYKNPGRPRPLVCLSNAGNRQGMPVPNEPVTCPPEWIQGLAVAFQEAFPDEGEVAINDPFSGGFITRAHSRQKRIPWIQVEINRNLYECDDYFDPDELAVDGRRIRELRKKIFSAMESFWQQLVE
jgi:N-formylglutamate deformylase